MFYVKNVMLNMLKNDETLECLSIYVDFGGIKNYTDTTKTAASRIVQAILNCRAIQSMDLLFLIVKCPFNKIKIL